MTPHRRLLAATLLLLAVPGARAQTVTRGPYLQVPTPTSMTLRWRTDVPTSSRVSYGAAPGALSSTVDDPTPTTEHVVTVGALAPDTAYYYAVGSVGGALIGDDLDHVFRTNPPPGPARPFRIFATGDGGFLNSPSQPALSANAIAVREAYYAFAGATPTDLFMPLGDNAYLTGTDVEHQRALFDGFPTLLRRTPVLPIYGNHEEFGSDTLTQSGPFFDIFSMPTAAQAGGVASGSKTYFSFDYANAHIVVLDSERARPADSPAMMAWLDADLAAANADWTIAMWHRPPYSRGLFHDSDVEAEEKWMRENVLPILEDYGVDAVFCGHSHNYERSYLLDGHYGLASTFTTAFVKDPGDGDPAGDGAYRKVTLGNGAHEGAVYVVAGSSSEVRNSTLNHPAHRVNLLEYGAVVIDVDGNALTSRFLNKDGNVTDRFQIVKGNQCPATPAPGCAVGATGKLVVKNNADDTKDKFSWKWKNGALVGVVGTPTAQTDLAVCVYAQNGRLVGGQLPHGSGWTATPSGALLYKDKTGAYAGVTKATIKANVVAAKSVVVVKAKGLAVQATGMPAAAPITAQLLNLDTGACVQSTFAAPTKNDGGTLSAKTP